MTKQAGALCCQSTTSTPKVFRFLLIHIYSIVIIREHRQYEIIMCKVFTEGSDCHSNKTDEHLTLIASKDNTETSQFFKCSRLIEGKLQYYLTTRTFNYLNRPSDEYFVLCENISHCWPWHLLNPLSTFLICLPMIFVTL